MYYKRICKYCGGIFWTKSRKEREYCDTICRSIAKPTLKHKNKEQLCWSCAKCTGNCSWSHNLTPVKGWTATPIHKVAAGREVNTYSITACPEFVRG